MGLLIFHYNTEFLGCIYEMNAVSTEIVGRVLRPL
jgi:hypothetical protein